jgi:hypothetical protein
VRRKYVRAVTTTRAAASAAGARCPRAVPTTALSSGLHARAISPRDPNRITTRLEVFLSPKDTLFYIGNHTGYEKRLPPDKLEVLARTTNSCGVISFDRTTDIEFPCTSPVGLLHTTGAH